MNQSILKSSISCLVEPQPSQPSGTKRTAIDSNLRQFDTKWALQGCQNSAVDIYIDIYIYHTLRIFRISYRGFRTCKGGLRTMTCAYEGFWDLEGILGFDMRSRDLSP